MGFSRHYFKDHNFLLTKIIGDVGDENLMEHVIALNKDSEGIINLRELADAREITSIKSLSVEGTTTCANSESNKPGSKLAILIPQNSKVIYGMARAFQTFSEDHREAVRIFTDFNESLAWLADDDDEIESLAEFVRNV